MLLIGDIIAHLGLLYISGLAATWTVEAFDGDQCNGSWVGKQWTESACISQGGNSWEIVGAQGCLFSSWSENNCRGSSTQPNENEGCQQVPFG
jgi:hypothetical protein